MKILRISDNKGFFRISEENEWKEIDTIDREGLMALLDTFLSNDVTMDSPDHEKLQNQAQMIIYKSVFEKLKTLGENKNKFKDESDRKYLNEIRKYSEGSETGSSGHKA